MLRAITLALLVASASAICGPSTPSPTSSSFTSNIVSFNYDSTTSNNLEIVLSFPWEDGNFQSAADIITLGTSGATKCKWTLLADPSNSGASTTATNGASTSFDAAVVYDCNGAGGSAEVVVSISTDLQTMVDCFGTSTGSTTVSNVNANTVVDIYDADITVKRTYNFAADAPDVASATRVVTSDNALTLEIPTSAVFDTSANVQVDGLPAGASNDVVLTGVSWTHQGLGSGVWTYTFSSALSYPFYYIDPVSGTDPYSDGPYSVSIGAATYATTWASFSTQTITVKMNGDCQGPTGGNLGSATFPIIPNLFYDCVPTSFTSDCPWTSAITDVTTFMATGDHPDYAPQTWTFSGPIDTTTLGGTAFADISCPATTTHLLNLQFTFEPVIADFSTAETNAVLKGDTINLLLQTDVDNTNDPMPSSVLITGLAVSNNGGTTYVPLTTAAWASYHPAGNTVAACPTTIAPSQSCYQVFSDTVLTETSFSLNAGTFDNWLFEATITIDYGLTKRTITRQVAYATTSVSMSGNTATSNGNTTGNNTSNGLTGTALIATIVGVVVGAVLIAGAIIAAILIRRARQQDAATPTA